jgi:sulfite exporter TauE/SafE
MRRLFLFLCLSAFIVRAQEVSNFNRHRLQYDKKLMLTLGTWATANLVGGGIGWATATSPEMRAFHQMNAMWNTVNFALALPGYFKAKKEIPSDNLQLSLRQQQKTEQAFLFNSGLDFAYITAGFLLRSMALNQQSKSAQWRGFGNGLVVQGSFLLAFDLTAYTLHRRHGRKLLGWVR